MNPPVRRPLQEPILDLTDWRPLGEGACALTYTAKTHNGARVVVKELFPVGAQRVDGATIRFPIYLRAGVKEAFFNEALTLDGLSDSCIPKLVTTDERNGTFYLVVEYIEGWSLGRWRAKALALDGGRGFGLAASSAFGSLLRTLSRLTERQLAHGDISPDNIVVRPDGTPALVDFGLAFHPKDRRFLSDLTMGPFALPRKRDQRRDSGSFADVYGLCASFYWLLTLRHAVNDEGIAQEALVRILSQQPHLKRVGTEHLVAAVDHGLANAAHYSDARVLSRELQQILDGNSPNRFPRQSALSAQIAEKTEAKPMTCRYQRCLLQSFDSPRFFDDDAGLLKLSHGGPLVTPIAQKFALARAEALLNICFGREILVPAGQIADSPGFEAIFSEIYGPYKKKRDRIARACERQNMPDWRPFRVGLESPVMKDYRGFTRHYRYTGADMVLIKEKGFDTQRAELTRLLLDEAIRLFNAEEFDALGHLMLEKAKRPNFGEFSRNVHDYFSSDVSIYADPSAPSVGSTEYVELFRRRLTDERIAGVGVDAARKLMPQIEAIEIELQKRQFSGFRGNWYTFRKEFGNDWQLARAYLDFRLFMSLSRQYDVDHPILVSQAVEAGRYAHSLFLGPTFNTAEDADAKLLRLAGRLSDKINWDGVFELFLDDRFLVSLKMLNEHYFSAQADSDFRYQTLLQAHGAYLGVNAREFIDFDGDAGRLAVPRAEDRGTAGVDAVDPAFNSLQSAAHDRAAHSSIMGGLSGIAPAFAMAAIAPLDSQGAFELGRSMGAQMLNYYVKPYRLAVARNA